jgi:radical SAM protein with 4Fe4S-binding SPASM domain
MAVFEKTVNKLNELYVTAGPYYLSEFYKPDGARNLHNFLTSVYQPEYQHNFRIIIVQDCNDFYEYKDLPGRALSVLQKYASQIDISNFFILVVSGNKDIQHELEQVRQLYSTDTTTMQSQLIDVAYNKTFQENQDTFCVLPWIHLYVGTDGNVLPCCVADHQYPMGSINNQSINDIVNSSGFNQIRKNMLNGMRSKECRQCYALEDAGLNSARQIHNNRWAQKKLTTKSDGTLDQFVPVYLDIRVNNICNLKCRMCSGYFSSAIAQEEAKLFNSRESVDTAMQSTQKILALEEITQYLPHAEKIYFAGGEPLLAPEHYKILNALIDCNNTDLEINYNTNFTTLTYKDISVLDIWKKFTNVTVVASLDAQGSVAEYVRHGTDWRIIESNLQSLLDQCPHVDFTVCSVVGLLNITSLIDLQKTWHANNVLHISKFSLTILLEPEHLNACVLPGHHKSRLSKLIGDHMTWCRDHDAVTLAEQWDEVLTHMLNTNLSHMLPEFKRLTASMDQYRNESFVDVFPDYQDLV